MQRRAALALPLALGLPSPLAAQGNARAALAAAGQNRWAEAQAAAAGAEPWVGKVVLWLRLQSRTAFATAAEITGFALANPDWPAQDALARRAEEALAGDADDTLAIAWFAERPPQTAIGYARLSDALARLGRVQEAETIRRIGEARAGQPSAEALARSQWSARNAEARRTLREGDARGAYALAAGHGQDAPGEPRGDAEFLAGFVALTRLRDAAAAERHFLRVGEDTQSVITRARSAYWVGRAAAAAGATGRARRGYEAAAALPLAFYGQLGCLALGEDGAALSARITRAVPPVPTAAEQRALDAHELTRVALGLAELGEHRRARTFLLRLEELAATPGAKAAVARLAQRTGRPDLPVWVARRAGAAGAMLLNEGWPTPYPVPAGAGVEPALIQAVTRQESNFDPEAVSSANARGLMQLLPGTAQGVARRVGLRHATPMLTTDTEHNMRLGAGYLEEMLGRFGGAMPFAIGAYNAGPGRIDEWLGTYGDPRGGGPPMLEWIELIPFTETRNYVQRVLEGVAIYRARDPGAASQLHPMSSWLAAAAAARAG